MRFARVDVGNVSVYLGAFSLLAAFVGLRSVRDTLFLSHFDAAVLPRVMVAAALVSIVSVLIFSRWMARKGPARAVPAAFGIGALALLAQWPLIEARPAVGAVVLYLYVAAFGGALISGFWAVVNERFDPHTAKQRFARIAATAASGGMVGGALAPQITASLGLVLLLPVLAAMYAACALLVRAAGAPVAGDTPQETDGEGFAPGLRILAATPYLRYMAGLVGLVAFMEALLDYALKVTASEAFPEPQALMTFFAAFYAVTGLVGVVFQFFAGPGVLRRFGLSGAIAAAPAVVLVFGVLAALLPRFWTTALVRSAVMLTVHSLYRSGFELLYTPLPPAIKRPTKAVIDVGSKAAGDLIGSGSILVLVALMATVPTTLIMLIATAAAALALVVVLQLHRGYRRQLAGSLRAGTLSLDDVEVIDATTERTIAATKLGLDRDQLLAVIEERRRAREDQPPEVDGAPVAPAQAAERPHPLRVEPIAAQVARLESVDHDAVRRALAELAPEPRLVAHVVPLLVHPGLVEPALSYLRRVAPAATGQLADRLLDTDEAPEIRRRVARILAICDDERAVASLWRVLAEGPVGTGSVARDMHFDLRFECARSAARIVGRTSASGLTRSAVFELVSRELAVDNVDWGRQGRRPQDAPSPSALLDRSTLRQVPRNVEHVFTLLALTLDREVIASTLAGLYSDEVMLRGTALEYLDVALPQPLRTALAARLEVTAQKAASQRDPDSVADELLRSAMAVVVHRDDRSLH